MQCSECGSPVNVIDGVVQYHTTLDTLTACTGSTEPEQHDDEPEAKPAKKAAPRKRTTKK